MSIFDIPFQSGFFITKNLNMIKIGEYKYATPKEYAQLKGVTVQTVYNWIKLDHVKTKKLMDKTLILV